MDGSESRLMAAPSIAMVRLKDDLLATRIRQPTHDHQTVPYCKPGLPSLSRVQSFYKVDAPPLQAALGGDAESCAKRVANTIWP